MAKKQHFAMKDDDVKKHKAVSNKNPKSGGRDNYTRLRKDLENERTRQRFQGLLFCTILPKAFNSSVDRYSTTHDSTTNKAFSKHS